MHVRLKARPEAVAHAPAGVRGRSASSPFTPNAQPLVAQRELEDHEFRQQRNEATRLSAVRANGTMTVEQHEQLTVLQAKMDAFWQGRLQSSVRGTPSLFDVIARNDGARGAEPAPPIQAKLVVRPAGDKYEQEADRVAARVVRQLQPGMAGGASGPAGSAAEHPIRDGASAQTPARPVQAQRLGVSVMRRPAAIQRTEAAGEEDEEEDSVQRKRLSGGAHRLMLQRVPAAEDAGAEEEGEGEEEEGELMMKPAPLRSATDDSNVAPTAVEASIRHARSGGAPLAAPVRGPLEHAFGVDFSGVKVHADARSDELNRSIQARAFTTGSHVFFRKGEYAPGTRQGQELLAHELTHVVQQGAAPARQAPTSHAEPLPVGHNPALQAQLVGVVQRAAKTLNGFNYTVPNALQGAAFTGGQYYHFVNARNGATAQFTKIATVFNIYNCHIHLVGTDLVVTITRRGFGPGEQTAHYNYQANGGTFTNTVMAPGHLGREPEMVRLQRAIADLFAAATTYNAVATTITAAAIANSTLASLEGDADLIIQQEQLREAARLAEERRRQALEAEAEERRKARKKEKKKEKKKAKKEKKKAKKEKRAQEKANAQDSSSESERDDSPVRRVRHDSPDSDRDDRKQEKKAPVDRHARRSRSRSRSRDRDRYRDRRSPERRRSPPRRDYRDRGRHDSRSPSPKRKRSPSPKRKRSPSPKRKRSRSRSR